MNRQKQIQAFKEQIPVAQKISPDDSTWQIALLTPDLQTVCNLVIFFPPIFPDGPPKITLDKKIAHPWVHTDGITVIGHPCLHDKWNPHVSVSGMISDILKEFTRIPPTLVDATYCPPYPIELDEVLEKLTTEELNTLLNNPALAEKFVESSSIYSRYETELKNLKSDNIKKMKDILALQQDPLISENIERFKVLEKDLAEEEKTYQEVYLPQFNALNERFSIEQVKNLMKDQIVESDAKQQQLITKLNNSDINLEKWKDEFLKERTQAHLLSSQNEWLIYSK